MKYCVNSVVTNMFAIITLKVYTGRHNSQYFKQSNDTSTYQISETMC